MRSRTANWFLCTIRYEKTMEDSMQKKVTEKYVVDAMSFTEAEARIIEEMKMYISGQFDVVEIDRCKFGEVFFMDWASKVLDNDAKKLAKSIQKKDKEAFDKWEKESLEEKFKDCDTRWYKARVQFITIDEKTEKEKKSNVHYLVEGTSLENARSNIDRVFYGTMTDYSIAGLNESQILDVFEHTQQK